mgnify:FL=1|tara:strand:- start:562 stop:969 length:408 start_codon:yes stop_codon:yes gene_type:complete
MIELNKKNMIIIVLGVIVLILFVQKIFNYNTASYNLVDFDNVSKTPKFVNFNTTWCYWSKKLQPVWKKLEEDMNGKDIEILDIKCDLEQNKDLCERYSIDGYPSIKLIQGNKIFTYDGDRSFEDMRAFINEMVNY